MIFLERQKLVGKGNRITDGADATDFRGFFRKEVCNWLRYSGFWGFIIMAAGMLKG
jgi:hypothetical protein